jgi:hypothetical protein
MVGREEEEEEELVRDFIISFSSARTLENLKEKES